MSNTTYNIYRDGGKIESNLTGNTFTDTGLTPNTEYSYQISTTNEVGESSLSEKVIVTTDYSPVEDVTVNKSTVELEIGDTEQLTANVSPNTAKQGVVWTSEDDSIATVDSSGNVEAITEGETTIYVNSEDDPEIEDGCLVTVIDLDPEPEPEPEP